MISQELIELANSSPDIPMDERELDDIYIMFSMYKKISSFRYFLRGIFALYRDAVIGGKYMELAKGLLDIANKLKI